jgi:hypothetical protein
MDTSLSATSESLRALFGAIHAVDASYLEQECGGDALWMNATLENVAKTVTKLQENVDVVLDLTNCSSITPILRQMTFGTTCEESVEGLTFLFSATLTIAVLCMVMLTTRAALFNPLIRGRRKKRRAKEFQEYKEYMTQFYNTSEWSLDPPGIQKILESSNASTEESDGTDSSSNGSGEFRPMDLMLRRKGKQTQTQADDDVDPMATIVVPDQMEEEADIEVVYYDSDSDSEDEESVAMSLNSSISAFVSHIWSRDSSSTANDERPYEECDESEAEESVQSISSIVSKFFKSLKKDRAASRVINVADSMACPSWQEGPYSQQIADRQQFFPNPQQQQAFRDPLNLGYCQNSIISDNSSVEEEMYPLSPKTRQVRAPRKLLKSIPRTSGASLYMKK